MKGNMLRGASSSRRRRVGRDEVGSGTVLILAVVVIASVLAVAGAVGAGYVAAVHRARAAADAAAVSAAAEVARGADGCRGAARIARSNGVRVTACALTGDALDFVASVTVEVSVPPTLPGLPDHVRATAHAGRLTPPAGRR